MEVETSAQAQPYYNADSFEGPTITLRPGKDYQVEGVDYRSQGQKFRDGVLEVAGRIATSMRENAPKARQVASNLTSPRWLYHTLISPDPIRQDWQELRGWAGPRFEQGMDRVSIAVRKFLVGDEIWADHGNQIAFSQSMSPMISAVALTQAQRFVDGTLKTVELSRNAAKFTYKHPKEAFARIILSTLPIGLLAACGTAQPAATVVPSPIPRTTEAPTDTPASTDTPEPEPIDTPEPTDTATPKPTDTPEPTDTPKPTDTATPEPTNAPEPTDTPSPFEDAIPITSEGDLENLGGIQEFDPERLPEGTIIYRFDQVAKGVIGAMEYPGPDFGYPVIMVGTGIYEGRVEIGGEKFELVLVPGVGMMALPLGSSYIEDLESPDRDPKYNPVEGEPFSFALEASEPDPNQDGKVDLRWGIRNSDVDPEEVVNPQ